MRKSIIILLSCVFVCVSCQEDHEIAAIKGGLSIYLADGLASARALPSALSDELRQQFQIELERDNEGQEVNEYTGLLKEFGENRTLRIGTYRLSASYGANKDVALDEPYYYGEVTDILIESNKTHSVTVNCKVANALATFTVVNPDVFDKLLRDYSVDITVGKETVNWKPGDTAHPYFKAGSLVEFVLKGVSVVTGEENCYVLAPIESVLPGVKYNYKLRMTPSNLGFEIVTEAQQESVTINETVPESWLPKAKFSSEGFDEQNILTYTETADAVEKASISYTALRPVQDVEFTLNFADVHYTSLNKTYKLSALSVEDKAKLEDAGIVLPTFDGISVGGTFDFHAMTPVMLTQNGGQSVDNQIKLKVFSNNRESETTYTIRTVKPVFKVGVYPGNIWTKEFTINPLTEENVETGNIRKFTNIQYEFSEDGSQWSAFGVDMHKEGLTPGTTYYVRAKYRGEVTGEVTEVRTYEAMVIPNSSLNEGYDTIYPKSNNPLYSFSGGWIDTRNSLTCHTDGANTFYVSKSSTLPVTDDNGNTVAYMMTIGWGAGNTCAFGKKDHFLGKSVINHINAGMLCVGNYVANDDVVHAKEAYIRPTAMSFVYKASPYNGDSYQVEAYLENITDGQECVIGKAYLKSATAYSSYQIQTLSFAYDDNFKRLPITHVKVIFKAGTIEDRAHLEDSFRDASIPYDNAYIIGSQFWLDSFELIYDK